MNHSQNIEKLLDATPRLWKGRRASRAQPALPTGQARLDARLPGGGWPLGAVSEIMAGRSGLGEFSLLLPALADIGRQGQWVVLVDPPWVPYPASLSGNGLPLARLLLIRTNSEKESLWACEQVLANGRGGAVLAWPERIAFPRLRRLQLAAEANGKLAVLFRPENALREASPAALRLLLEPGDGGHTRLQIVKCRGNQVLEPLWLTLPRATLAGTEPWLTPENPAPGAPAAALPATGRRPLPAPTLLN